MKNFIKLKWLPVIFFLVAYLLPLANRPLITPDEFRYADIPRTMVESGDYVSPRLLGIRYFEKPALGYQISAVAMKIFGENRFSVRLGSALAVALTAWLLFFAVRRLRHDEEEACWASLLYLGSGMVFGVGTFAVLDSQTTAFITGTVLSYFIAINEEKKRNKFLFLSLCGIFCGLAFLTKGFIAMVVPAIIVLPYLVWSKRYREIFTTPWIPMILMVIVALPWSIMIHLREPDFWRYFFWVEHINRFISDSDPDQHPYPFWVLTPPYIVGMLPGMVTALGAFVILKREFKQVLKDDFCRFMLCYTIIPLIFFSASSGKLATYILPCFPPLAILLSLGVVKYWREGGSKVTVVAIKVFRYTFIIIMTLLAIYELLPIPEKIKLYSYNDCPAWPIFVITVIVWCLAMRKLRNSSVKTQTIGFFIGLMVALATTSIALPVNVIKGQVQEAPLYRFAQQIPSDAILVAYPNVMHAVSWVFEQDHIYLLAKSGELDESVVKTYPDEYGYRLLSFPEVAEMVDNSEADVVIFVRIKPKSMMRKLKAT